MFIDENGKNIDVSKIENTEQTLASLLVLPQSKVLELGARYGTVTCKITQNVGEGGVTVCVEPDSSVWSSLETNLATNKCDAKIIKGLISLKPMQMKFDGYSTHALLTNSTSAVHHFSLQDALNLGGVSSFDTLVADCEGCLESFIQENDGLLNGLHTIIFEADRKEACDYFKVKNKLKNAGFSPVLEGFYNAWIKNRPLEKRTLQKIKDLRKNEKSSTFLIICVVFLILVLLVFIFWKKN